jgi:hypothetical protein
MYNCTSGGGSAYRERSRHPIGSLAWPEWLFHSRTLSEDCTGLCRGRGLIEFVVMSFSGDNRMLTRPKVQYQGQPHTEHGGTLALVSHTLSMVEHWPWSATH